jgi:hypothetical protein
MLTVNMLNKGVMEVGGGEWRLVEGVPVANLHHPSPPSPSSTILP